MKAIYKIFLVFVLVLTTGISCYSQIQNDPCGGGEQQPPKSFDETATTDDDSCADGSTECLRPVDPNEIIGLNGYDIPNSNDTMRWVSSTQYLMYTIYFENDPNLATAAAQRVEVRHKLHTKADMSTFGIGSYGIGQNMFVVDGYLSSYQTRLDLTTDTSGYYVDVIAGLDIVTNEAFWIFQTIDPQTGLPPIGINDGFLPVNDSLHSGEGQVTFRIKPKEFLCVTGDTVTAKASIVFDVNEAIPTNIWLNTIDAVAPTTSVNGVLNASQDSLVLQVSGGDDLGGSGFKQFKLYASENDQPYVEIGEFPVGQTTTYPVIDGKYYRFISLGEDNVGNIEPMKTAPDFEYGVMMCNVSVIAFPEDYGAVSGSGLFARGTTITVSSEAIPNHHLVRWASEGITQSYDDTYTFTVESDIELTALFEEDTFQFMTQYRSLTSGWNWYSTFIELNGVNSLEMFENAIGNNAYQIVAQTEYTYYYDSYDTWYGSLTSMNNESTYKLKMRNPYNLELSGIVANPLEHPISIGQGWNYIGYVSKTEMELEEAFSDMTSSVNDVVKTNTQFAEYYEGYGWYGSLQSIKPGDGLMYKSNNPTSFSFTYPANPASVTSGGDKYDNRKWRPVVGNYKDNMTVTAVVELDGVELASDNYELTAFDGAECRGSIRLAYIEPLNRHYAFLTVTGEDIAELQLGLYDAKTGEENYNTDERVVFSVDDIVGSLSEPFVIRFQSSGNIDGAFGYVQIYPNPQKAGEGINIVFPDQVQDAVVEILSPIGEVITSETVSKGSVIIKTPDTPGIYMVRITRNGHTVHRKVVLE